MYHGNDGEKDNDKQVKEMVIISKRMVARTIMVKIVYDNTCMQSNAANLTLSTYRLITNSRKTTLISTTRCGIFYHNTDW